MSTTLKVKDEVYWNARVAFWRDQVMADLSLRDCQARVRIEGDISFEKLRAELFKHLGVSPTINTYPDCPTITLWHSDFPELGESDNMPEIARIEGGEYVPLLDLRRNESWNLRLD